MKVFLTSAHPFSKDNYTVQYLTESAAEDPFKVHRLVDTPEEAEIIIFAEGHVGADPYFFDVINSKIYKRFKQKCYLYQDHDIVLPLLRTITPSLELKYFNPSFTQPFSYIIQLSPNDSIKEQAAVEKKLLFSFVGASRTHEVRKRILEIKYDRCLLSDTSDKNSWELSAEEKAAYQKNYAKTCFESKFILCPRGIGPNSYRLYESLQMGIPPVIISDDWVPTTGPDWETFSVRVAEADVKNIPAILEKKEAEAAKMGQLARQAWLDWFAKDKQFHNLTEACLRLQSAQGQVDYRTYAKQYLRFLEPFHARSLVRYFKNKLVDN